MIEPIDIHMLSDEADEELVEIKDALNPINKAAIMIREIIKKQNEIIEALNTGHYHPLSGDPEMTDEDMPYGKPDS